MKGNDAFPEIVVTETMAYRKGERPVDAELSTDDNFSAAYDIVMAMSIDSVQSQLWKIGFPYERIAVRVLDWEEAVTRLKSDELSMLAMCRMIVAIEGPDRQLWIARTVDIVTGKLDAHKTTDNAVQDAIDAAFKRS